MKIGILVDQISPGSLPRILGAEVRFLSRLGNTVEGISLIDNGRRFSDHFSDIKIRYLDKENLKLLNLLSFKFPFFSFFSSFHLTGALSCPRILKEKEYDVIVSHATYTCFSAKAIAKKRKIPYFAFIWDPISYILPKVYSKGSLLRCAFPVLLPAAKYFDNFLVSDSLAVITCSYFHVPLLKKITQKNIEVVYPGCDPLEKIPESRGDYILAIDRWDIGNTPNKILDVFDKLSQRAKLLVAGYWYPERIRDEFIDEIKKRGFENRVEVRGPAEKEEVRRLLAGARALIHPNEEVFGFVPHEAASCGCPMLMPKASGNTEIYEHGKHGFFPDGWNVKEFAGYLTILINDERLAWRMGNDAWQVARGYTWQDHAISLEKVIKKYIK